MRRRTSSGFSECRPRGAVIPVFHVGRLLGTSGDGLEPAERILMVARKENPVGLLVDEVREVIAVPASDFGPAPDPRSRFVEGIARKAGKSYRLLDPAAVAALEIG